MRLQDLQERLEQNQEFPVDCETLIETYNDVEIDAPNGEPTRLATLLERVDEETFHSVDEAYDAISNRLDDAHVGRRRYDDRSSTGLGDRDEQSF